MKVTKLALLFLVLAVVAGCTKAVPPGYVGMIMEPGGLTGVPLEPGNHSCWGRDKMVLIEAKEAVKTEALSVLCADDLNFKFDLKLRSRIAVTDGEGIEQLLRNQGANIQWDGKVGVLKFDVAYQTYVQPVARSIARTVVSKYSTTQIRDNREAITKAIQERLLIAIEGTPMEIPMMATSNFDYPDVITKAVEKKRQREIEIDEEKAKQAMRLLEAENRMKVAQKLKVVRAAEAEAEAAYIRIVGKALTERYLQMREIEARLTLYGNVGAGDKVIVAREGAVPLISIGK